MADLVTDSMDVEEYMSFSKLRKVNYCECTPCSPGDQSYTDLILDIRSRADAILDIQSYADLRNT